MPRRRSNFFPRSARDLGAALFTNLSSFWSLRYLQVSRECAPPPGLAAETYRERPPSPSSADSLALARFSHKLVSRDSNSARAGATQRLPRSATPLLSRILAPPHSRPPLRSRACAPSPPPLQFLAGARLACRRGVRARALALLRAGVTLGASGAVRARDPKPRAIKGRWRRRRVPALAGWTGSPVPPLSRSSSCLGAWLGKLRPQGWEKGGRDGRKLLGPVHLGVCSSKLSRWGLTVMSRVLRGP